MKTAECFCVFLWVNQANGEDCMDRTRNCLAREAQFTPPSPPLLRAKVGTKTMKDISQKALFPIFTTGHHEHMRKGGAHVHHEPDSILGGALWWSVLVCCCDISHLFVALVPLKTFVTRNKTTNQL